MTLQSLQHHSTDAHSVHFMRGIPSAARPCIMSDGLLTLELSRVQKVFQRTRIRKLGALQIRMSRSPASSILMYDL